MDSGLTALPCPGMTILCGRALRLVERLLEVGEDVVLMLDAERQADIAVGDAGLQLLLGGQLRMRRRRRMNREAARIADIGDVIEHLERVDKAPPGILAALQFEAEQPAIAALQISVGAAARLAFHDAGVNDLADLRVAGPGPRGPPPAQ